MIAFSLVTYGAFSVSSTAECLKDSELVRKDTELRLNIPERGAGKSAWVRVSEWARARVRARVWQPAGRLPLARRTAQHQQHTHKSVKAKQ